MELFELTSYQSCLLVTSLFFISIILIIRPYLLNAGMKKLFLETILRETKTSSFSKYIRSYFKNDKILSLLEFPILFLGAMPKDTPALYSLMNYANLYLNCITF